MTYAPSILGQAHEYLNGLAIGERRTIDPATELQYYPFLVVADILFGRLSPDQRQQLLGLGPLREELFREVIRGGVNRWSIAQYLPWSGVSTLSSFQQKWHAFVSNAYRKALEESPEAPVVTLWQAMHEGKISEREVGLPRAQCLAELELTLHCSGPSDLG